MAEPRMIRGPDGQLYQVPDEATDAQISAYLGAIPESNASEVPRAQTWKSVAVASAAKAAPLVERAAAEVATNPRVPKVGSVIGQVVGGVQGALRSPLDAAGGAWAGGKAGWFTGKLAQKLSTPVATALEALAPYLEPLGYAPALQGDQTQQALGGTAEEFQQLPQMEQVNRLMTTLGLPKGVAMRAVMNLRAKGAR